MLKCTVYVNLRFFSYITVFIIIFFSSQFWTRIYAQEISDCKENLREAETYYRDRNYDEAIDMINRCLQTEDVSDEDKIEAYELLARTYLEKDIPDTVLARKYVLKIFYTRKNYMPDPVKVKNEFVGYVKKLSEGPITPPHELSISIGIGFPIGKFSDEGYGMAGFGAGIEYTNHQIELSDIGKLELFDFGVLLTFNYNNFDENKYALATKLVASASEYLNCGIWGGLGGNYEITQKIRLYAKAYAGISIVKSPSLTREDLKTGAKDSFESTMSSSVGYAISAGAALLPFNVSLMYFGTDNNMIQLSLGYIIKL